MSLKKISFKEIINNLENYSIKIKSDLDEDTLFSNISSISNATENDISFFSNIKYLNKLAQTKAKACLIKEEYAKYLPKSSKAIIVNDPYFALASISQLFNKNIEISNGIISNYVTINKTSKIHSNVQIDSFSFIDTETEIHENVRIGSNTKIGPNVIINENCIIHDNVTISNSIIHNNCEIKPGARIGNSGFGFEEKSKNKIFHNGNVIIYKYSTIGSNTTIDRAVFDSTVIGEFSQIDNLVQIAHNVCIGKHAIIAAQTGIAGSTLIGDYVKIGGQVGVSGHLNIGNNVTIAGKSGVTKDIPDNNIVAGFPAKNINLWKKEVISLSKLK